MVSDFDQVRRFAPQAHLPAFVVCPMSVAGRGMPFSQLPQTSPHPMYAVARARALRLAETRASGLAWYHLN